MAKKRKNPAARQTARAQEQKRPAPSATGVLALRRFGPPLFLLFLTIVFYWPILSAKGFFWNDFVEQNFPYRLFAAVNLRHGVFPFWNPYVFSGMPFFADVQAAVLYPLNLLLTPFAGAQWLNPVVVEYQIVFHVLLAGLFMYWLCRDLAICRAGALVGAIAFMFCAFITTHIFHVNLVHTAVWFPLVVLLLRRAMISSSMIYASLCAIVLTNAFLAGYPQLILHIYYWMGAVCAFFAVVQWKTRRISPSAAMKPAALFAAVVVLSAGMSAVQLLPTNDLGKNSERPTLEFRESCEASLRPYRLVTLLAPNFFGTPDKAYWGYAPNDIRPGVHSYWETAIYCGIITLLLALVGAAFVRRPIVWFLSAMALLSLFLAMGDSFLAYWIAYYLLPLLNRFRIPGRFAFMFTFSVSVLAGFGVQWLVCGQWREDVRARRLLVRSALGIAAAALLSGLVVGLGGLRVWAANFISMSESFGQNLPAIERFVAQEVYPDIVRCWWVFVVFCVASLGVIVLRLRGILNALQTAASCVALISIDMLVFLYGSSVPFSTTSYVSRGQDPSRIYATTSLVSELQKQLRTDYFRINSRDSRPGTTDLGGRHMVFQKNQGSVHRLFLMEGYNPLRLKRQLTDRSKKGLDILNVKYTIQVDESAGRMGFALNDGYFPRARMVYSYEIVDDEGRIPPTMWSDNFDYAKTIILEEKPGIDALPLSDSVAWTAKITGYGLNEITVDVSSERDGFLVLSEIHYPWWKATVDGTPAKLLRADYALRAIEVPAGEHHVRCSYDSRPFKTGRLISLLCLCATAGLCMAAVAGRAREKKALS